MIELNKVGVEIDGKVYELYRINFGFQRKLIELNTRQKKMYDKIAKKYQIEVNEVDFSDKPTDDEKLELAEVSLNIQEALSDLFVNKEDAKILNMFNMQNATELIICLQ